MASHFNVGVLAEGIAESYGARAEFRWFSYLPVVNNDVRFTEIA